MRYSEKILGLRLAPCPLSFLGSLKPFFSFSAGERKEWVQKTFLRARRKPEEAGGQYPQGVCRIRKAPSSLTAAQSRPPLRVRGKIGDCNDVLQLLPDPHPSASQTPSPEGKAIRCGGDRRTGAAAPTRCEGGFSLRRRTQPAGTRQKRRVSAGFMRYL